MWRFRIHRPLLFFVMVVDFILVGVFITLTEIHAPMDKWVTFNTSLWLGFNILVIWRDGVN
jgi:hypothetical protein